MLNQRLNFYRLWHWLLVVWLIIAVILLVVGYFFFRSFSRSSNTLVQPEVATEINQLETTINQAAKIINERTSVRERER